MPKITLKADATEYHGTDPQDNDRPVDLKPGESVEVSDEKVAQLTGDFPDQFEVEDTKPRRSPRKTRA